MVDSLEEKIVRVVQEVLSSQSSGQEVVVTAGDSMETLAVWDSISFMSVFLAINEAFDLAPDFDDAIHYTSVKALRAYLGKVIRQ